MSYRYNSNITENVCIIFYSLLVFILLALKIHHIIEWSWLWVLAPLWMPLVIIIITSIVVVATIAIGAVIAIVIGIIFYKS